MTYLFFILVGLTAIFWLLYRLKVNVVCSICAATVLTFGIGVVLLYRGITFADVIFIALLAGMSIGALAEKYGSMFGSLWKMLWVFGGALGIYFLLVGEWQKAVVFFVGIALVTGLFKLISMHNPTLADKFKNCC